MEEILKHALDDLQEVARIRGRKENKGGPSVMRIIKCRASHRKGNFDLRSLNMGALNCARRMDR